MRIRLALAMILVWAAGSAGGALELREAWRFPAGDRIASPTLLRRTEAGPIEGIVFTAADGRLVCLDGAGKVAWTQPIARLSHSAPAVGDVDGDGEAEIVVLDADGVLFCLTADGTVEWTARLRAGARAENGVGLCDLDGDGAREIVVGDGAGKAWCFDGRGNVRWTVDVGRRWFAMPTFADLDGDAAPEIIISEVDHHLYCLNRDGEWLWEIWRRDEVFGNSGCTVADLTGDGMPEVLVGGGLNHFFALDGRTGQYVREINTREHINSAMASADLEGDGLVDVVFGTRSGTVYRIGRGAEVAWMRELEAGVMVAPVIADLTGDGRAEIVVLVIGHAVVVLDAAGEEVARFPLSGGAAAAPAVGDVDGDGMLELLVPDKRDAELVCLETGAAARPGAVAWESMRGDAACTGNPAGVRAARREPIRYEASRGATFQVTEEIAWLCGENERTYALGNPESRRVLLAFEARRPSGMIERTFRHTAKASASVECGVFVDESGPYRVTARLLDVDTRALLHEQSSTQTVDLFARDVAQAERTIAALDKTIAALAAAPADVREYLGWAQLQARGQMQRLRSARGRPLPPAEKADLIGEAMSSRRRVAHLRRLAEFVLSRPEAERGRAFTVWAGFPWHRFEAASAAPPADAPKRIELEAYLGEAESACVNITNFRGRAAAYRVEMGPVQHAESEATIPAARFQLREAVEAPSTSRFMVADALTPLNDARAVTVGPWESRQVWVTLTAAGVEPGDYAGRLTITSVEPFPASEEVEVRVRIWPIELPSPGRLRFCNWVASPRGEGAFRDSFVRQVLNHGVNVIPVGSPSARFDQHGSLVAPIVYTSLETALQAYPEATFLCSSPQHSMRVEGAEMFSEKWVACYRKYLTDWVRHLEKMGVGTDRFLLYPVDEASIAGSPQLRQLTDTARITKQINPRVRVFANPSMGATIEGLTELGRYVDVWCPSQELMDREGVPLLDFFKKTGREVWFYDARGEARTLSGIAFFRRQAWQAWHFGLTGMGFYACMGRPDHAWAGPTPEAPASYFDVVYSGRRAIASKRYEGSRDGKEDFEAMTLLRQALQAARAAGADGAPLKEARRLLEVEAEEIWQAVDELDDRCEIATDGSEARRVVERMHAFRRRAAQLTLELRGLAPAAPN